ncbi:Protein ssh4 [Malassezia vespertilionis]|uniref:Ssh4p n=1 Tax=Malassezia vespertilionis TaxID=2020962 RepID=A0A2N1JD18_9BASI|nr:Protein ssh4 [Malassezia vespertilionis]PKI84429.1 Ssh4p [Malassezia vespertilionis]WFD06560.1 Protein ssh4 [Malassezia vespertilionis]
MAPASFVVYFQGESDFDEPDFIDLLFPILLLIAVVALVAITPLLLCAAFHLRGGITLSDVEGPINVAHEEQRESTGALADAQAEWLEHADPSERAGYALAAQWCLQYPPLSPRDTDITMPQFLGIQEKGVSAWNFDPDYEVNQGAMVSGRTEIQFLGGSPGMSQSEGGACTMQSNLPLPKMKDVYYWEAKMFSKPATTTVAIGLATKPYPSFRFPGYCKHSVGYFSHHGLKCYNHPFHAQSYGPAYIQGDVIGVGFRPRTGAVFFTQNGRKLGDAFVGLHEFNLFPTIAADGPAEVHVNFGQAGFVLIEANVKRWGLAPMVGTLAPPPAYGHDIGSILIETGCKASEGQPCLPLDSVRAVASPSEPRVPPYALPQAMNWARSTPPPQHGIRMDTLHSPARSSIASPSTHEIVGMQPPPYSAAAHAPPDAESDSRAQEAMPVAVRTSPQPLAQSASRPWLSSLRHLAATWHHARDADDAAQETHTELLGVSVE